MILRGVGSGTGVGQDFPQSAYGQIEMSAYVGGTA